MGVIATAADYEEGGGYGPERGEPEDRKAWREMMARWEPVVGSRGRAASKFSSDPVLLRKLCTHLVSRETWRVLQAVQRLGGNRAKIVTAACGVDFNIFWSQGEKTSKIVGTCLWCIQEDFRLFGGSGA